MVRNEISSHFLIFINCFSLKGKPTLINLNRSEKKFHARNVPVLLAMSKKKQRKLPDVSELVKISV